MKVGILTFHASHNYGSMLQAYALQHTLAKIGIQNEIINFRSDIQKSLIPPPISWKHPRSSISEIIHSPLKTIGLLRKYKRFETFLKKDLNVGREINLSEEIPAYVAEQQFDAIITGSDQIWNPDCWDFDLCYALDFSFNGKRIAYAPSMGSHPESISAEKLKPLLLAIKKYSSISTRECRGSNFISATINRKVDTVLDPTLLLKQDDYNNIQSNLQIGDKPYMFYYTPREHKGWFEKAKSLAKYTGLRILVTQDFEEYRGEDIIRYYDCGPREFLSLIKQATICIGDSFHLLAFSLIFNKEFYLISNELDSRMMNVLSSLALEDRLIVGRNNIHTRNPIPYDEVNNKLESLRRSSMEYLTTALS